jgi:hypothetical protein
MYWNMVGKKIKTAMLSGKTRRKNREQITALLFLESK